MSSKTLAKNPSNYSEFDKMGEFFQLLEFMKHLHAGF
jgi:hypothetical protein